MSELRLMKLYGSLQPVPKRRELTAGPLSAVFEDGALRSIRMGRVEVIRMIAFLCRNRNWGTYAPSISGLKVKQSGNGFSIRYAARAADAEQALTYDVSIEGEPDGSLRFHAGGLPESDFLTNRTGFVVLHPLVGVVGAPLTVTHIDGAVTNTVFPESISPGQPVFGIRSMKHGVLRGLSVTVTMGPDKFEMEDHRNWMDASYKTYVRSLLDPWPYTLKKGERFEQEVSLSFEGRRPAKRKGSAAAKPEAIRIGKPQGKLPALALGHSGEETNSASAILAKAGLRRIVTRLDGRDAGLAAAATSAAALAASGAAVTAEIVLPGAGPAARELPEIASVVKQAGFSPAAVVITCAEDIKSYQPNAERPWRPSFADMAAAARSAFPGIPLGGGMVSFFTELNRSWPDAALFDFITHSVCPTVHAADDVSVMETLEAIPSIAGSVRAKIGSTAYHLGPSSIAARDNPYGAGVTPNAKRERVCLAGDDPRQDGLFAAAFTLGLFAGFVKGGAASIAVSDIIGPRGIAEGPDRLRPVFHIVRQLAAAESSTMLALDGLPEGIAGLAFRTGKGARLLVANLTPGAQAVSLPKGRSMRAARLDARSFDKAVDDPGFLDKTSRLSQSELRLDAYAVERIDFEI